MLAIETTYLGPTNTKGARIRATVVDSCASVTLHRRYQNDMWVDYRRAVEKLCEKLDWGGNWVGGKTERGAIWVCASAAAMKRNTFPNPLVIGPGPELPWEYSMVRGLLGQPGVTAVVHFGGGDGGSADGYTHSLLHVERHSPTGFEMGYAGSGPADLALSILVHYFRCFKQSKDVAMDLAGPLYQEFLRHFIAPADGDELRITDEEIDVWLSTFKNGS